MKTWIPDRYQLSYLTWKQVEAIPKEEALIILPTAAIEQHGHHLPAATDSLLLNFILGHALQLLPPELPIYALEPVVYGKSNEHLGFPGTFSLRAETLMALLHDLAASVKASGFKNLVLYNMHGGNAALIEMMGREIRAAQGLRVFCLLGGGAVEGMSVQESTYGYHAGEMETAIIMAATPELVDTSRYTASYIRKVGEPGNLLPERGGATFAWLTRDISPSGVLGDPDKATAENGWKWMRAMARHAADSLVEMFYYRNDHRA